jgi:hypothetical protein
MIEITTGQHFIYQESESRYVNGRKRTTTRRYRACVDVPHQDITGAWWVAVPFLRTGWVVLPEDMLRARLDASAYDPATLTEQEALRPIH